MVSLFRLAAVIIDFAARFMRAPPPRGHSPTPTAGRVAQPPPPATSRWHSRFGGRAWRYDSDGVHTREPDGGERLWRTSGAPLTCRAIMDSLGDVILWAARKHGVSPALILMTIATETASARVHGFTGPATFRWEPHVLNRDIAPTFRGTYSAGPMQILATTARDLIATRGADYGLNYASLATAPALRQRPPTVPAALPLYDARTNVDLGAAVIRRQLRLTGNDPILVAAAYNAGGVYESGANAWRLRSHGNHLDRAARWYGDACAVLAEAGSPQPR